MVYLITDVTIHWS